MPPSPRPALLLTVALLALAGCGDDEAAEEAATRTATVATTTAPADVPVVTSTQAAPSRTVVVPPATTVTTPVATTPSGGTPPPTTTVTVEAPPAAGGPAPSITVRPDGTARATASDEDEALRWCAAAREGDYAGRTGDATTLVVAVAGTDSVTRCDLPR